MSRNPRAKKTNSILFDIAKQVQKPISGLPKTLHDVHELGVAASVVAARLVWCLNTGARNGVDGTSEQYPWHDLDGQAEKLLAILAKGKELMPRFEEAFARARSRAGVSVPRIGSGRVTSHNEALFDWGRVVVRAIEEHGPIEDLSFVWSDEDEGARYPLTPGACHWLARVSAFGEFDIEPPHVEEVGFWLQCARVEALHFRDSSEDERESVGSSHAMTTSSPWKVVGVSRSSWYRMQSEGLTPKAVELPGVRRFWKLSDLQKWVERQKAGGRRKSRSKRIAS